jgi:hypothetical protein
MNATVRKLAEEAGIDAWWDSGGELREVFDERIEAFAKALLELAAKEADKWASDVQREHGKGGPAAAIRGMLDRE